MTMRVLHVNHTSQRGGAELALVRLLSQRPRWRAVVAAPPGGPAFDPLAEYGIELRAELPVLPGGGTRGVEPTLVARYLLTMRSAARILRERHLSLGVDLVHANSAAAAIVAARALRGASGPQRELPLVVHLRDLVGVDSLGRAGHLGFTRVGLPRADGVIANSRATLASAEPYLPADLPRAVLQSPSGIVTRVTSPTVADRVTAIGMIGRLQAWKGQHILLRAFALAVPAPVRLYLAGAPLFGEQAYERQLLSLAAELGIADRVVFCGHVEDIGGFVESVDVLVHASTRAEPLGQAVLQGIGYGKPIIATIGGGPSEWLTDGSNGLLVPPGDVEALATALRAVAGSVELRRRLAAGAAGTPGLHTDDECVAAHAAFFEQVRARRAASVGRSS